MLIDTNIILEVLLKQERAEKCAAILDEILIGKKQAYLSVFNLDSIILYLDRNIRNKEEIRQIIQKLLMHRGLKIYFPKISDRLLAINLMKKYALDYEDALTLQAAISTNSKEILSFDKHFDKVKGIKRIEP